MKLSNEGTVSCIFAIIIVFIIIERVTLISVTRKPVILPEQTEEMYVFIGVPDKELCLQSTVLRK